MAMLFQAAEIPRTEIPTKDHFHPASPSHRHWGLCCQGTLGVQRKERCEGKVPWKALEGTIQSRLQGDEQICVRSWGRDKMAYLVIPIGKHPTPPYCTAPESWAFDW